MGERRQIPANIVAAARRSGLRLPLWYCGPVVDPSQPRKKTLDDILREADERRA